MCSRKKIDKSQELSVILEFVKRFLVQQQRPRLAVYRSEKNIYAQVIDDVAQITLVSASSVDKAFEQKIGSNKEAAKLVGKMIAERALEKGIEEVVFDRGGYVYHGRVQNLAEGAREAGLKF